MSGKKSLFLVLALVLPVGIFLFLKFFGRNEFEVEPLFQLPVPVADRCGPDYVFPYVIPDSIAQELNIQQTELTVVIFALTKDEFSSQVNRIEDEFSADPVQVKWWMRDDDESQFARQCIFLMNDSLNFALLDKQGRIRGQYDATSLDEMDRLIVEMRIILKKY